MLRWRLLVAAAIIAPLAGLLLADYHANGGRPGIWLTPLVLLLTVTAVAEVLGLLRHRGLQPAAWSTYTGTLLVVGASLVPALVWPPAAGGLQPAARQGRSQSELPLGPEPTRPGSQPADAGVTLLAWPAVAMALAVVLAFVAEMLRYRQPGTSVVHVALGVLTVAYVGGLLDFLIALRVFHGNRWGLLALLSAVFVTKMADTGAYACGRLFGRHKMTPVLSPKKTVEGGIGGLVTACLSAGLFFYGFVPWLLGADDVRPAWWGCLLYGVILGVAGTIGDLAESLLKRDMECKDSSRWMPGLGGVLDVLDSLLIAAPAAYLCWLAGIVGPGCG